MIEVYEKEGVSCVEATLTRSNRSASKVYLFLVDGMLIDTGPQNLEDELIPFYRKNSIDNVVLTHSHEDHTGTAAWLQNEGKLPVFIHSKGITACEESCSYPKYRQIAWGVRQKFNPLPLGEKIQSRSKEWKVIYTPGHSDDHVALFHEETGRLFSGDLFVTPKPKVVMKSESISKVKDSIRKLLIYNFQSMFCSHAGYIPDGKEMLREKLIYLESLTEKVKKLYMQGDSPIEIDKKLFPKRYRIIDVSEGEWDSLNIISSVISDIE